MLEPGCGSGNFIGLAPDGAEMTGVERDPVTAAIAAHLYPQADIRAESFADTRIPAMYFDGAVGNVPFGKTRLSDPAHNPGRRLSMHNHFIVKSLELTRPGGMVALVTSRYTMDARNPEARRRIAALGDLVAAIRLPDGAHRRAAGTDVVTDLLILRRRDPGQPGEPQGWELAPETNLPGGTLRVNEYFTAHPEFVLGEMKAGRGPHGENDVIVTGPADASAALAAALETAVTRARAADLVVTERPEITGPAPLPPLAPSDDRIEGLIQAHPDGTFTRLASGAPYPYKPPATQATELRLLTGLRDTVLALLRAEAASSDDTEEINGLRATLNTDYRAYLDRYGPVKRFTWASSGRADPVTGHKTRSKRRPPQGGFRNDPLYPLVDALEESYHPATKTAVRADIFTQRVVVPETPMLGADTADEALAICLNKHGEVRLDEIAGLLGASEAEARAELGTLVFDEPGTGRLIWAPIYLSGDVRAKLATASSAATADPRFEANTAALGEVVPRDLGPAEIEAQPGAGWITPPYVQQFLRETLGDDRVTVERSRGRKWKVSGGNRKSVAAINTWGTRDASAHDIAQRLLTGTAEQITIKRKSVRGTYTDQEATEAARQKARELADRFSIWVWEDTTRTRDLCRVYNDRYNAVVPVSFDGVRLFTPGLSKALTLHAHQPPAIARVIYQGSAGLVHGTGAGKTLETIIGVRERQRLGLSHKPCFVVQKNKVGDFRDEFLRAYPDARLLVADTKDLTGNKRREFIARCATGNPTAIIMSREAFRSIPVSAERLAAFLKEEEIALEIAIEDARKSDEDPRTIKQIEAELENTRERRKEQAARIGQDRGLTYEDTGIDYLVLDEARAYRKGPVISSLPGMADPGSARALDLLLKLGYHHDLYGETRVCLADATPFTNKISEIYTWLRYLHYDIEPFDDWVRTFGKMAVAYEMVPGGDFKAKARLREIINAVDLHLHLRERNDFKLEDSLDLKLPVMTGGKPQIVQAPASDEALAYFDGIRWRYEHLPKGPPEKGADNHLKVLGDFLKASLDLRLVGRNTSQPQKVDVTADVVYDKWVKHRDNVYKRLDGTEHPVKGGLILVFASLGTPGRTRTLKEDEEPGLYDTWNFYDQLRANLAARGMPAHLIRFMHEADGNPQRLEQLFHDARNGAVHVLVGSTEKLGVGVNVQDRAVGLVQVTAPWNWDEPHQELGRVRRLFNQNAEFFCIRIVTSPSADAIKWERSRQKELSFRALMTGEIDGRTIRIPDDDLSSAEIMAAASGDPRMLERAELEGTLGRLDRLYRAWKQNQTALGYTISDAEDQITGRKRAASMIGTALGRRKDTRGDAFTMTIDGQRYTKRTEAADRLRALLLQRIAAAPRGSVERDVMLGEIGGFTLTAVLAPQFANSITLTLEGIPDHPSPLALNHRELPEKTGIITRLENRIAGLEQALADAEAAIGALEHEIADARASLGGTFPQQAEYDQASARLTALEADLAATSKPSARRPADTEAAAPASSPPASTPQPPGHSPAAAAGDVPPRTAPPPASREPRSAADSAQHAAAPAGAASPAETPAASTATAPVPAATALAPTGRPDQAASTATGDGPASGLVIEHGPAGTLVRGTSKNDYPLRRLLRQHGFKWSGNLEAWYLPRSWNFTTRSRRVTALTAGLRQAGRSFTMPAPPAAGSLAPDGAALPGDQHDYGGDAGPQPAETAGAAGPSGHGDPGPPDAGTAAGLRQLAAARGLAAETVMTGGTLMTTVHDDARTVLLHDDISGIRAGGERLEAGEVPAFLDAYARYPQLPPGCLADLARHDPAEPAPLTLAAARETAARHGLDIRIRRVSGHSYITFCEPGTAGTPVLSYPAGSATAWHGPCAVPTAVISSYLAAYRESVPAAMFTVPEPRDWARRVTPLTPHLIDGSGHLIPAARDRLRAGLTAARDDDIAEARTILGEAEALIPVALAPDREAELTAAVRRHTARYGYAEDPAAYMSTASPPVLNATDRELEWVRSYIAEHPEIRQHPAADEPAADPAADRQAAVGIARQAKEALDTGDYQRALALIDEAELVYPHRGISYDTARDQVRAAISKTDPASPRDHPEPQAHAPLSQDTPPAAGEPADEGTRQRSRGDHLPHAPAARSFPGGPIGSDDAAASAARAEQPESATQVRNSLARYTRPDGTLDPERQKLHDQIVERILAGHQPQEHPVATFLGGGTGSGKSALAAGTPDARIDADTIKKLLPEYQEMLHSGDIRAAAYTHEESSALAKRIEREAQQRRCNYILDGTGDTSFEKMAAKVARARAAGYGAAGKYVTVDTDTAVQRARKRAERTGRMVPESVMRAIHASVSDTFARAAAERLFDALELLDNNEAGSPKVIARDEGTGLRVLDPAAYDRFLAKGEEGGYAREHRSADSTPPASETGEVGLPAARSAGHAADPGAVGRDRPGPSPHAGPGPGTPRPLGLQRGLTPEQSRDPTASPPGLRGPAPRPGGQAREPVPTPLGREQANALIRRQRQALARAVRSKDPHKVILAAQKAVSEWNQPGMFWPDDWSRWQRALDDALPLGQRVALDDLPDLPAADAGTSPATGAPGKPRTAARAGGAGQPETPAGTSDPGPPQPGPAASAPPAGSSSQIETVPGTTPAGGSATHPGREEPADLTPAQPPPAALTNSDLAAELCRLPGFARWLSLAGTPPAAGDLDAQFPGAGSAVTCDARGIEITVSGPGYTRHGLVTWPQAASWIDSGVTPARLGLVILADRLATFCRDNRDQLITAGTCDPDATAAELGQIRDDAIAFIVTAAGRSRGTAVPVPPAKPDDPAWYTTTMITRPARKAGKAENAALERLTQARILIREPQPATPAEIRATLRRWIGSGVAGAASAKGDPAPTRAWISSQASQAPGDYDRSGERWYGASADGLITDRNGDDRAPVLIRWEDIPAWIQPGITSSLRDQLLAASDASSEIFRRQVSAAVREDPGTAPSEEEAEQARQRLSEAADAAWAAIEAAPPPSSADLDRARRDYADWRPVQQTLFDDPPPDSTPARSGTRTASRSPAPPPSATATATAAAPQPELPARQDSPVPPAGPEPGPVADAENDSQPENRDQRTSPGHDQPAAPHEADPARAGTTTQDPGTAAGPASVSPAHDDDPEPAQAPATNSDLAIALHSMADQQLTDFLTRGKTPNGSSSLTSRGKGQPDSGAHQELHFDRAGVRITIRSRRVHRHGQITWRQVASWLDAGLTPARLGTILAASGLHTYTHARRDELIKAGNDTIDAAIRELSQISTDAINAVLSATLGNLGADSPVPPARAGKPAYRSMAMLTGPDPSATTAENAALARIAELGAAIRGTQPVTPADVRTAIRWWIGDNLPEYARALASPDAMRAWIRRQASGPASRPGHGTYDNGRYYSAHPEGLRTSRGSDTRIPPWILWEDVPAWIQPGLSASLCDQLAAAEPRPAPGRTRAAAGRPPADPSGPPAEPLPGPLREAIDAAWAAIDAAPPPSPADLNRARALYRGSGTARRPLPSGPAPAGQPGRAVTPAPRSQAEPSPAAAPRPAPGARQDEPPAAATDGASARAGTGSRPRRAPEPAALPQPAVTSVPLTDDDIFLGISRLPASVLGDLFHAIDSGQPPESAGRQLAPYAGERAAGEPDSGARETVSAERGGLRIQVATADSRRSGLITWQQVNDLLGRGLTPDRRRIVAHAWQVRIGFTAANASFRAVGEGRLASLAEDELRAQAAAAVTAALSAAHPAAAGPAPQPADEAATVQRITELAAALPARPTQPRTPAGQVTTGHIIGHPGYRFQPFRVTAPARRTGTAVEITGTLTEPSAAEPGGEITLTLTRTGETDPLVSVIPVPDCSLRPLFPAAGAGTVQPAPAEGPDRADGDLADTAETPPRPAPAAGPPARQPHAPASPRQEDTMPPAPNSSAPPHSAAPQEPGTTPQARGAAGTARQPGAGREAPRSTTDRPTDGTSVTEELERALEAISERRGARDGDDFTDIRTAFAAIRDALRLPAASPAAAAGETGPVAPAPGTRQTDQAAAPPPPRGEPAPAGSFDDIRATFADLRDILGLPATGRHARSEPSGGTDAAIAGALDQAAAEAQACARWYRDTPEWQRISTVSRAARDLITAIRQAAGDYWSEIRLDIRVRGFARTLAARTALAVSGAAHVLAGRLERAGHRDSRPWRAAWRLHQVTTTFANRVMGYTPPGSRDSVREARRVIDDLAQRQDRPGQPGPGSHAAPRAPTAATPNAAGLARSSFPAMVTRANARQAAAAPASGAAAHPAERAAGRHRNAARSR